MDRNQFKPVRMSTLALGIAALSACGGDGDLGPQDLVTAVAPRCARTTVIDNDLAYTQLALTRLHELVSLASISPSGAEGDPDTGDALQPFDIGGDCGGWIYFTPQPGTSELTVDYQLDMQAYCMNSADGDIVFNGLVSSQELARLADAGEPEVYELHTNFTGLEARQGQQLFSVSMTDGKTVYGVPTSGRPLPSTAANPDLLTIGALVVNHESAGIVDRITQLKATRWVAGELDALLVKNGTYRHGQSGDVFQLANNGAPLLVDDTTGVWRSGTLKLLSANNPPVEVRPTGNTGEYIAVVPGNASGELMGCEVIDKLGAQR